MSTTAHDLDAQLEDLERVKQEALGQRDAILGHTDDALVLLANVRLCAEQLAETQTIAMRRLDTIPGFDAELPELVDGYADLNLSATARTLLDAFNAEKLADLQAGLDSAQGAILRYRARVADDYERHHGEPVGWRPFIAALEAGPVPAPEACACPTNMAGDIRCHKCGEFVNKRCWNCGTPRGEGKCPTPARPVDVPPPASGDVECCASGSCEVCMGRIAR